MDAEEITKVQELIYTTKVENVMAPDVIVVSPDASMSEVKALMSSKRVSGLPVMDGDRMVGMISMSDLMNAVETGKLDSAVSENMSVDVKTISKDAYAVELVSRLGRRGQGRVPVVDGDGKLVGIVTTGTMMQGLLREMDIRFKKKEEEERLHRYRASHIFEDIVSDDTGLLLRYVVGEKDFDNAGKASSQIKRSLQRLAAPPGLVRRVAVAVYEAEINLVIHTDVGGEITVEIRKDRLKISAVDHGPGIEDVQKVLQPGYSTAPEWIRDMGFGAGMGLANIKRCADFMSLTSELGGGTRLEIHFLFSDMQIGVGGSSGKKS
jgi:CBS domain-containing protein/anti-sigma regulatory factor (Ser/Thr protein kinase)